MAASDGDSGSIFSGDIDPDVAALIGVDVESTDDAPDFSDLFGEPTKEGASATPGEIDMTVKTFTRLTRLEDDPKPHFSDKNYYKTALTGEGDMSKRVHTILGEFLNAKDSQDRSMHRGRFIPAYWELFRSVVARIHTSLPAPKQLMLRFGMLLPSIVSAEQRSTLSRVIMTNDTGEPIHYADEWLREVGRGRISASATDETKPSQRSEPGKVSALLDKTQGRYDAQLSLIRNVVQNIQAQEQILKEKIETMSNHDVRSEYGNLPAPYNEVQRSAIGEITNVVRRLSTVNKELASHYREIETLHDQLKNLKEKEQEVGAVQVDNKVIGEEANTIRQMAKLCVGRQGNHFPILMKQYFRPSLKDIGTRENVVNILADAEYLDPSIFLRTFKMQTNRIVPNVVLIPCYGEHGICWEPFERFNRASSRGRLAIPMFPKDLRVAVIAALGDLRWQVAKERAQHYWMEEGLTGWYYMWFSDNKMRGDVKDTFIQDYVLWITKESEGTQKLERDVRAIFWRYMPFPQDVKDNLKNRGFVYSELYKKDQNRAMSDGY